MLRNSIRRKDQCGLFQSAGATLAERTRKQTRPIKGGGTALLNEGDSCVLQKGEGAWIPVLAASDRRGDCEIGPRRVLPFKEAAIEAVAGKWDKQTALAWRSSYFLMNLTLRPVQATSFQPPRIGLHLSFLVECPRQN